MSVMYMFENKNDGEIDEEPWVNQAPHLSHSSPESTTYTAAQIVACYASPVALTIVRASTARDGRVGVAKIEQIAIVGRCRGPEDGG